MKAKLYGYGGAGLLLLAFSVVVSLSLGSAGMSLHDVWGILTSRLFGGAADGWNEGQEAIVLQIRLPRVMLAILIGAALALAGAGFQGVLRNPLADPFTLGVASGCSVGAAFLILFGYQTLVGIWTLPVVAFVTGIVALAGVLALARTKGAMGLETLILSGVVIESFLGSLVSFMVSLSQGVVNQILFWLMGSIALKGWSEVYLVIPFIAVGLPLLLAFAQPLNLFVLGERHAAHLGVRVERTKLIVLAASTLLTAAAVSVAGVIGFVGLVVPHLIRLIAGPDYRLIIPLSAIGGGIFVLWADTLARIALSPREIQLGVVTAFIGAPFFAYLLYRRKAVKGGTT
ncbi:FecCD family ABC transporter permease [Paenibacillus beijingensis]|uniref:Iron ABC transporter n=1 Tax=Paenibacillus beijingensis TaxID=1126833 RepID=A0A0D5NSC8_9BACL|nr:iron ABC transporter permease [Paenibacillus beijingensis]AJY77912.1 iron ABC transporter [Paenibacillus beijingensis]